MLYSAVIWFEISCNALSYSAFTCSSVASPPVSWAAFLNNSTIVEPASLFVSAAFLTSSTVASSSDADLFKFNFWLFLNHFK